MIPFFTVLMLGACNLDLQPAERNCKERQAYWPDTDSDGVGEPTAIYIGCSAPEGWVEAGDSGCPDTGCR